MNRATLTETRIKSLKPKDKPYKVSDGTIGGLHVAVSVAGGKVFCLAYRFDGKWRLLRLGTWPVFNLEEARDLARNAKKQLATGTTPPQPARPRETKSERKKQPSGWWRRNGWHGVSLSWASLPRTTR